MTNDNNTRKKANAVFFSVLMVISMVAVGFAAAPAAAADANSAQITFDDQAIDDGNVTVQIDNVNSGGSGDIGVVLTYNQSNERILAGATTVEGASSGDEVEVEVEDTDGFPGVHTAHVFNQSFVANSGLEDGDPVSNSVANQAFESERGAVANAVFTDSEIHQGALVYQGQAVAVSGLTAGNNYVLRQRIDDSTSQSRAQLTARSNGSSGVVFFNTASRAEGNYFLSSPNGNLSNTFEIVTQDLSAEWDDDTVDDGGSDATTTVDLQSDIRSSYPITVSADGLDDGDLEDIFGSAVTSSDADDDTVSLGSSVEDGDVDANFTGIDAGEYEFTFDVTDSTAEDTASITVEDVGDGEVNIEESSLTTQQGDTVEFTVTSDGVASDGSVVIGGEDDFGYEANVTINDFGNDDEVTLRFNTYSAGLAGEDAVSLVDTDDDDDDITVDPDSNLGDILAQGDYDISSSVSTNATETLDNPDDVATLFIDERSTDGIQTWTASDDTVSDISDADDDEKLGEITSAAEDGTLTQTSSIAHDDVSVHQLSASGLTGLLEYAESNGAGDTEAEQLGWLVDNNGTDNYADGDNHVRFRLRETRASAGPNANRITVPVNSSVIDDVVVDEENDEYYVFVDTSNLGLATDEDYEFDVQFRVQDERLIDPDEDEISTDSEYRDLYQQVSAQFNVEERDASFDADPYNVTPTDSEEVTGTTNVAPGTEFTVRARSKTGTQPSFVKTNSEVNVSTDGTWSTTFDFSEQNVGDEYTLRINQLGLADTEEVDGTVVEEPEEPANFAVSDLSAPGSATQGDVIDVSATIENTGEATATQTVEFQIEGDVVLEQDIELSGGESTTVEYTDVDTSSLDPGDYEHGVFTNDDSQTATLTVEAPSDDGGEDDSSDDSTDDSSDDDSTDDSSDDDSTDDSSSDDSSSDDSSSDDSSSDDDSTDDSTPGFGALVALVALIAAALLATRRRD